MSAVKINKNNNLTISIDDPKIQKKQKKSKKKKSQKESKQIQIRKKHQIEQMQSEVKKLNQKIQAEHQILRNKILCQQLECQLKKNQIASKMSKKQIIMRRLDILKGQKQAQERLRMQNLNAKNGLNHKQNGHKSELKFVKSRTRPKSLTKQHQLFQNSKIRRSIIQQQKQQRRKNQMRTQKLKQIWNKQKQYGNRVQRQYSQNRAKSAFSHLQFQKLHQLQNSQKLEQRNRILSQIKKPPLPITINAQLGRRHQVDRIESSNHTNEEKLLMLNYLSQVELNRVNLRQIRGKDGDMDVLNYINRARTQIMLDGQ